MTKLNNIELEEKSNPKTMKQILVALLLALCHISVSAQNKIIKRQTLPSKYNKASTTIKNTSGRYDKIILGKHLFSSQWISWDNFGKVVITKTKKANVYNISGIQDGTTCSDNENGRSNGDYLKIQGTITVKSQSELVFNGKIVLKIYHLNNGQPCIREGEYHFLATEGRRYWRMQEMNNPCDGVCDYVDIFFK